MDIQVGDRVTYKDLDRNDIYTQIITYTGIGKDLMNSKYYEIIKIERPVYEVVEEKKELLTEEEREFLKQYIKIIEGLNNGKIYLWSNTNNNKNEEIINILYDLIKADLVEKVEEK